MKIDALYSDITFHALLLWLAKKNRLLEFEDFRQQVFAEIIECGLSDTASYKRAANRIAKRLHPDKESADIMSFAAQRHSDDEENEYDVMSRLTYHQRASVVCNGRHEAFD